MFFRAAAALADSDAVDRDRNRQPDSVRDDLHRYENRPVHITTISQKKSVAIPVLHTQYLCWPDGLLFLLFREASAIKRQFDLCLIY